MGCSDFCSSCDTVSCSTVGETELGEGSLEGCGEAQHSYGSRDLGGIVQAVAGGGMQDSQDKGRWMWPHRGSLRALWGLRMSLPGLEAAGRYPPQLRGQARGGFSGVIVS